MGDLHVEAPIQNPPGAGRGPADPGRRRNPDRGLPERLKRMVGKVLTGNGITSCERGTYALVGGEELSDAERDQLLQLYRQHLDPFREQRGEELACLYIEKPTASATAAAPKPRSAAPSQSGCSPAPEAAASAARHTSTSAPWTWTTSCPGTRAAQATSATCRLSASAAMRTNARRAVCCALEGCGRVLLESELVRCIAAADLVIKGQAMSFQSCPPRAMGSCQVQR